jgi:hypothetical protein
VTHGTRSGLRRMSLPLFCPLPGQNERAESAAVWRLSALATELVGARVGLHRSPVLRTSKAIVSPGPYQVRMNLLRLSGCGPMLKNYTGHFIREKVDILFRDSDDFLFRY